MASDSRSSDRFPRLHLAWQQERTAYLARRQLRHDLMKLEGLVAHRELQLVRAMSRNDRRYIKRRQDKLQAAQDALKRLRTTADRNGVK
jgi:hypothetical protein